MDGDTRCVCCGERLEPIYCHNHHCAPKFESMRAAIDRREREPRVHVFSEAQRLSYGFFLMLQSEN